MPGVRTDIVAITIVHIPHAFFDVSAPGFSESGWKAVNAEEVVTYHKRLLGTIANDFGNGWRCVDAQEYEAEEAEEFE
jgi:hypothetical protein